MSIRENSESAETIYGAVARINAAKDSFLVLLRLPWIC